MLVVELKAGKIDPTKARWDEQERSRSIFQNWKIFAQEKRFRGGLQFLSRAGHQRVAATAADTVTITDNGNDYDTDTDTEVHDSAGPHRRNPVRFFREKNCLPQLTKARENVALMVKIYVEKHRFLLEIHLTSEQGWQMLLSC